MPDWVVYLLRMLLALGLGFAMGVERKIRFKEAGMRTHSVVAGGAALFILVSKYGFPDVANYDAARVAAQVVSGIGFLGAGMILHRKQAVHGLTTAAGVWFTAGIGMACGAGMYWLAVGATAIIILVQCLLHINCGFLRGKRYIQFKVVYEEQDGMSDKVKELFGIKRFLEVNARRSETTDCMVFTVLLRTEKDFDEKFIAEALTDNLFIRSINRVNDEE